MLAHLLMNIPSTIIAVCFIPDLPPVWDVGIIPKLGSTGIKQKVQVPGLCYLYVAILFRVLQMPSLDKEYVLFCLHNCFAGGKRSPFFQS